MARPRRLESDVSPPQPIWPHLSEEGPWRSGRASASWSQPSFSCPSHSFQAGEPRRSWFEAPRERRWCVEVPSQNALRSACVGTSGRPSERGREGASLVSPCGRGSLNFSRRPRDFSFPDWFGAPGQEAIWLVTLARLSLSSVLTLKQPERSCMQVSRRWGSVRRRIDRGNPKPPR